MSNITASIFVNEGFSVWQLGNYYKKGEIQEL